MQTEESVQIGDYVYYHPSIGRGKFSRVYFGYHNISGDNVAVKKISKKCIEKSGLDRIENEVALLKKINHENIVSFRDVIIGSSNIYIICEFANGGDLKGLMNSYGTFGQEETKFYVTQIRDALSCLSTHNIVHRDLKPKNLLINFKKKKQSIHYNFREIQVKIADFGFAKQLENHDIMSETLCGTPYYMAPEIICDNKQHRLSDIWSVGIIIYELYFGCYPFGNPENIMELKKEMQAHYPTIPKIPRQGEHDSYCNHFYDLITEMLCQDPEERITWEKFFNHKWFTCGCFLLNTETCSTPILNSKSSSPNITEPLTIHNKRECSSKIVFMVEIIDDYCTRPTSFSAPKTSAPIQIVFPTQSKPIAIPKNHVTHVTTSTYKKSGIFSYIGQSIDNLKRYASNNS